MDYGRIQVQGISKRLEDQTDTKTKQRKTQGGVDKVSGTSVRSVGRWIATETSMEEGGVCVVPVEARSWFVDLRQRQGHTSDEGGEDTDMKVTGCLGLSSGIPFEDPSPSVGIFYMPFPGRPGSSLADRD